MGEPCKFTRQRIVCWVGWFFFINSILAFLIIFGYLPQIERLQQIPDLSVLGTTFAYGYFILAFFAQASFYMIGCALVCLLLALILPWRWPTMLLATILSAILLIVLIGDTIIYRLFHMHYILVGWQVYKAGAFSEVMPLGTGEKFISVSVVFAALLFQLVIAWLVWNFLSVRFKKGIAIIAASTLGVGAFVYISFGLAVNDQVWSPSYRHAILRSGRIVPYLSQIYLAALERKPSMQTLRVGILKTPILMGVVEKKLQYPLQPLVCKPVMHKLNVLILGIDTWRYTSMNAAVTPNIYAFSKQAIQFNNHFSGGNCTGPGIFSLFYGLSPTYWTSFLEQRRSPVLLDQFQKAGYQVRAFLSAQSNFPRFDQTIFVNVPSLSRYTVGNSSIARDRRITEQFNSFLQTRDKTKPFFTFMFYDALHNYCESEPLKNNPFQPAATHCDRFALNAKTHALPYLNLYNNKAHFVDQQIANVLNLLKQQHLLRNTIVIITADHGEQMNDEGLGLWGHASSYSRYQLHVPMIVYWPGVKGHSISRQTTHYDIVPTLLTQALSCKNKPTDYGVGVSLFAKRREPYFIAGSYGDYAILYGGKSLRIYPDGDFQVANLNGQKDTANFFDQVALQAALRDSQRFFQP